MEVKLHKLIILGLVVLIAACNNNNKTKEKNKETETKDAVLNTSKGEELAKAYCASCHKFVPPSALDKQTWQTGIFPAMGPRMGIYSHKGIEYESGKGAQNTDGIFHK